MDPRTIAALPARPDEIPEWEDLLVRFEILPRVLRVTLEEAARTRSDSAGILRRMLETESAAAAWIDAASPGGAGGGDWRGAPADDDPQALADRIGSLRARNFAMLQRRGIDVWEWTAPLGQAGPVTAYQVVAALVRDDAAALEAIRNGSRLGAAAC